MEHPQFSPRLSNGTTSLLSPRDTARVGGWGGLSIARLAGAGPPKPQTTSLGQEPSHHLAHKVKENRNHLLTWWSETFPPMMTLGVSLATERDRNLNSSVH